MKGVQEAPQIEEAAGSQQVGMWDPVDTWQRRR